MKPRENQQEHRRKELLLTLPLPTVETGAGDHRNRKQIGKNKQQNIGTREFTNEIRFSVANLGKPFLDDHYSS
jgi:hypothetical protein